MSYSGDTEWTDVLLEAADRADVFIAEAYFYDKAIKWHLDYATLAANAGRITASQTIVTHMSEEMLGHVDSLDVVAAHDGLIIDL